MTGASALPLSPAPDERVLTGWARTSPTAAHIAAVANATDVQAVVRGAGTRGVLARGLGRSYGDPAQNAGGAVIDGRGLRWMSLDRDAGTVTAGAGVSLDEVMRAVVPAGFFVPVTPGTRQVTVGGAIGADVHGKNHHVDGTFGAHVTRIQLVDGTGELRELTPDGPDAALFWATVGGMGLTGVIVEATFRLLPITSSRISVDTERCRDLDDVMARMVERDDDYRYSVAWIDTVSKNGRGALTRGDHAPLEALPAKDRATALTFKDRELITAPSFFPNGLLNKASMAAFNEVWYRKHPERRTGELQSIGAFFHPLDMVGDWNRIYGPAGFLQYQFVVPDNAGSVVALALKRMRDIGAPSFLTVLKRFGAANPAPLSFPQPGWTLAADVPTTVDGLDRVLNELDEVVASHGGRLYFAKDSRTSPAMIARMYPRLGEWQAARDRLDPNHVFSSDLERRLSL